MSITKLIKDQTKLFSEIDKKFAEKVTPQNYQARIKAVTDTQEKRIEARIKSLEKQKAAAVARYDAAIKVEKEALAKIKSHQPDLKQRQGGTGGTPRKPDKPAPAKPRAGGTKKK
ncbi:hypothetical protein AB2B41_11260 [Marimonas sp. MJW-29]|uniref:Uncharacterized protein n=1 Tax=Sulfitobacter sediminis TaxID=3234186 RepID=A0ABV3RMH7_9RHOB